MNYEETKTRIERIYETVAMNMQRADARMDAFVIALADLQQMVDENKRERDKLSCAIEDSRLKAKESRANFDRTIKRLNAIIDSLDARNNRADDKQQT